VAPSARCAYRGGVHLNVETPRREMPEELPEGERPEELPESEDDALERTLEPESPEIGQPVPGPTDDDA